MKNTRRVAYYPLQGGEDLTTPLYSRKPGTLIGSRNFECDAGGRYRRVAGYERYDGRPSPSDASYWYLAFDAGTATIAAGATVTGQTSSASGIALIDAVVTSGSYAGSDAAGYLILYNVSLTFVNNENLRVGGVTKCVLNGTANERGATTTTLDTTYYRAAVEARRTSIAAVPGSGNILGVWPYNGTTYAFRNNAGGTAAAMYKSTTSGWTLVNLGYYINFTLGTAAFVVGQTVTGAAGATAVIKTLVKQSGTWAGGNAAGYLVVSTVVGTFVNPETITSATGSARTSSLCTAITLTKDGRYEFANYNFGGHAGTYCMYGCDGVNYGFQFDGTTYTPIRTGMTTDTPEHLFCHKKHLFFSFNGGSSQHSSIGAPLEWSAVTGASELGVGENITGYSQTAGDLLAIFGRNSVSVLSGTGSANWSLSLFSSENGAIEWSIQRLSEPLWMDNLGLSSLAAVQEYGNFKSTALSSIIEPFFTAETHGTFVASVRIKAKEQYRIFYDDGTGLNLTFSGNKITGFTRLKYDDAMTCCSSGEDTSGNEVAFFGGTDGMVYQLEKGTSFDGGAIIALFQTSINNLSSPENTKRFFKIVLERDDQMEDAIWGIGHWSNFEWGGLASEDRDESYLDETGTGYDYVYYSSSAYLKPFVLQGIILHYSIGGLKR